MNLNHVNLPVPDVAATRDFFAKYFGMRTVLELAKGTLVMMRDEGGMVLNLSHFDKKSEIQYHKDFHVGFFLETRDEVDAVHARMLADGVDAEAPRKHPGRYGFNINAPGGFITEVAAFEGEAWAS